MSDRSDLIQVVQQLSFCRELDEVMAVLRQAARRLTGADGIAIVLRDGDLCHYADEDAIAPLWKGIHFPMKACIAGWCMLHAEQVVIADIYQDARILHNAYRPTFVKSLVMTPIRSIDPIGAIGAYWATHHQATEDEMATLRALGDSASMAMANVQLIARLKDANQRKDQFLSMLAHELRNPLAPIRNGLHVLRLSAAENMIIEETRQMMERQLQHLSGIVEELLDVARLTNGRISVHNERVDLGRLVRQSVRDHVGLFETSELHLTVMAPQTPVWVIGDPLRLRQIIGNLLDNAHKFTPAGGQVDVEVANDPETKQAVLHVRDNGIGIGRDLLPHLFETFSQADRSLERTKGGLGLGLSLVRGLLELQGGTIEAHSDGLGHGSEFIIRLPREPELPALAGDTPAQLAPKKKSRVLVVEDNRDSAESLRMLLKISGYDVSVAFSGPEGVKAAKASKPDLVLCDIGLPGMDGFAVAGALRGDPSTANARLIAVTGYGSEEDRRKAVDAGFIAHLTKPVDPEMLLGQMSTYLA